jgi:hypothetical protein
VAGRGRSVLPLQAGGDGMSKRTDTTTVCDIPEDHCGEAPGETVTFRFGARDWEIDLCERHKARFAGILAPHIEAGRDVTRQRHVPAAKPDRSTARRLYAARVRAFGIREGLIGKPSGRIPVSAFAAYEAALGRLHAAVTDGPAAEIRSAADALADGGGRR